MIDSDDLHMISQLVDNIDKLTNRLEKAYNDNDSESFKSIKKEILDTQKKISKLIAK